MLIRFPNPMFAGMFAAGLVHTSVCFYVEVMPSIYNTHLPFVAFAILWTLLMYYMYYTLMTLDPGQLNSMQFMKIAVMPTWENEKL